VSNLSYWLIRMEMGHKSLNTDGSRRRDGRVRLMWRFDGENKEWLEASQN
jgi:hypothetical protein